jgi:hypothetical protein
MGEPSLTERLERMYSCLSNVGALPMASVDGRKAKYIVVETSEVNRGKDSNSYGPEMG